MTFILVLLLSNPAGLTSTNVQGFTTVEQCQAAGEAWKAGAKKLQGVNLAQYMCVPAEKG